MNAKMEVLHLYFKRYSGKIKMEDENHRFTINQSLSGKFEFGRIDLLKEERFGFYI